MVVASTFREDYWTTFEIIPDDVEFLYNYLLELELPQTSDELLIALVKERIQRERRSIEEQRSAGGDIYYPKEQHKVGQSLVFPALGWQRGEVTEARDGKNPDIGNFQVIMVEFANGERKEYASSLDDHLLNQPPSVLEDEELLDLDFILENFGDELLDHLEEHLSNNDDFVRIAGRWFPRALLIDVNAGHLNLAEAILDMAGGGPMSTAELVSQVELPSDSNPKLVEFSMDLALQEDERFDEVGPAGQIVWFLRRLEPPDVLQAPLQLQYIEVDYDRSQLTPEMIELERKLDDELSPFESKVPHLDVVQVCLIYPHWRAGTLPLSRRMRSLFPTAHEAPRIQFTFVDGDTGEKFSAWVVRPNRYVYGLREWYDEKGIMPGSIISVSRSQNPGEVIVTVDNHRPQKEYVPTVLVGSDGGTVFAMLKQTIATQVDDRMSISIPDLNALDSVWEQGRKDRKPFEKVIAGIVRELARLNPQSHVHASALYAAVNVIRRCPPGPILALLASRPWFSHVGDLHFRFDDSV